MRRKKIWLIFLILTFLSFLFGEEIWTQFYDPFYASIWKVEDVIACSDGGYAINGSTFDDDTLVEWGFVIKTDSEGNLEWAEQDIVDFQPNNEGRTFIETDDGGFISSSYWFENGNLLLKRGSNGNVEDTTLLEDIAINSMCRSSDNNIMLAGHNYVNWQTDDDWPCLIKIDQNSEILWSKYYEFDNYDWGVIDAVIQSSDNGFLLAGRIRDPNNEDAVLVIKTNSVGDTLWTKILDETEEDDKAKTIIETDNGDIFVGGYLEGITAGFLWKLDAEGNTIWFESGNESCGYGFTAFDCFSDGKIISTFGDVEMNSSIRKFDNDYNIDWTKNLQLYFGHGDKTIRVTNQDNVIVALLNASNSTAALIKMDSDGTPADNDISEIANISLYNYPNPFYKNNSTRSQHGTTIEYFIPSNSKVLLQIFNIKGQLVKTIEKGMRKKGNHTVQWKAPNCASGIYFSRLLINDNQIKVKKITIIK